MPVEQVPQQIEHLRIPRGYLVEFSYRRPINGTSAKNTVDSVIDAIQASGGLSAEAANEMNQNSKRFREEFSLD